MDNETVKTKTTLNGLEYDEAFEILKKYGYSSATTHPYMYQNGDDIGLCYSYIDADYGSLERIKTFESAKELDDFLKQMKWLNVNASNYHIRMALDNYETIYPRILFLRNEKIMVPSEMEDMDTYDYNMSKRANLDDTTKIVYETGDILIVYDELKARQLAYLQNLTVLKNTLRQRYYDLQLEVDKYNRIGKVERHLTLITDSTDNGIDYTLEMTIKDRYNQYVSQSPTYEEAIQLLKEAWDMCRNLEANQKYYEAQVEDNNTRNEIKLVEEKLELMKDLNDDVRPFFGEDIIAKFRKINREFAKKNNSISNEYIQEQMDMIDRKYNFFEQLDLNDISEYLKESISNTNFEDLSLKYRKGRIRDDSNSIRLPLNEIAANLTIQFKEKLDSEEQSILVLHNNLQYRMIIDAILGVDHFETLPVKNVIKQIRKINGFSKFKSDCYDVLKKRIDDPINVNVKNTLFKGFDFTSFETFISSLIPLLVKLKNLNNKMVLNSDINMYTLVNKPEDVKNKLFVNLTNDINTMYAEASKQKKTIALVLLKSNIPVLYSPYTFDMGDIYSKGASPQVYIKETIGFELLVENGDVDIKLDDNKIHVVNYQSKKETQENLTTVIALEYVSKTSFCKMSFLTKEVGQSVISNEIVQSSSVSETELSKDVVLPASVLPSVTLVQNEEQAVDSKVVEEQVVPVNSELPIIKKDEVNDEKELPNETKDNDKDSSFSLSVDNRSSETKNEIINSVESNPKIDAAKKEEVNEIKPVVSNQPEKTEQKTVQQVSKPVQPEKKEVVPEKKEVKPVVSNQPEKTEQKTVQQVSKSVQPEKKEEKSNSINQEKKES